MRLFLQFSKKCKCYFRRFLETFNFYLVCPSLCLCLHSMVRFLSRLTLPIASCLPSCRIRGTWKSSREDSRSSLICSMSATWNRSLSFSKFGKLVILKRVNFSGRLTILQSSSDLCCDSKRHQTSTNSVRTFSCCRFWANGRILEQPRSRSLELFELNKVLLFNEMKILAFFQQEELCISPSKKNQTSYVEVSFLESPFLSSSLKMKTSFLAKSSSGGKSRETSCCRCSSSRAGRAMRIFTPSSTGFRLPKPLKI